MTAATLTHRQVRARGWLPAQIKQHLAEHRVKTGTRSNGKAMFSYPAATVMSLEATLPGLDLDGRRVNARRYAEDTASGPGRCCPCSPLYLYTQWCACTWCGGNHFFPRVPLIEAAEVDEVLATGKFDFELYAADGALEWKGLEWLAYRLTGTHYPVRRATAAALKRMDVVMGLAPADSPSLAA
jgi:hypothetical protein